MVTGGSRGIGAAVCTLLGRQGYKVVVNYNSNSAKADAVVAEIKVRYHISCLQPPNLSSVLTCALIPCTPILPGGWRYCHRGGMQRR